MSEAQALIADLAAVLCVAALVTVVFRRLGQPVVLGYLLVGAIVGPHTPVPILVDEHRLHVLSELGVVLVMFVVGLELSVAKLLRVLPRAGLAAVVQMGGMFWLGQMLAFGLGGSSTQAVFVGAMLAISSTMIVARTFADQPVGASLKELVYGVLVIQDVAAILLLTLLSTWVRGSAADADTLASTLSELFAFLVLAAVVGFFVIPAFLRWAVRIGGDETLTVSIVGTCFGYAALAAYFGYSVALGAFLSGTLAAESGHAEAIEARIAPLRDVFAAVFFVSVGTLVVPSELLGALPMIAIVSVAVIVGQTVFVSIGGFLSGVDVATSIRAGLSLSQIGELSFIIAALGTARGVVDPLIGIVAVGVVAVTATTTPFLVRHSEAIAGAIERRLPKPARTFVALYGTWIERLRRPSDRSARQRLRRALALLLVDGAIVYALVAITSRVAPRATTWLSAVGVLEPWSLWIPYVVGFVIVVPFLFGLVRATQRLGRVVAFAALPAVGADRVDMAASPRGAFVVAVELAAVLVIGLPLVALTQPFLPPAIGFAGLIALVVMLILSLWQRSKQLDAHVRAGSEVVLEILRSREPQGAGSHGDGRAALELPALEDLLPGLGEMMVVSVGDDSPVVGRSLGDLDLEARANTRLLAIRRAGAELVDPKPDTRLEAGDRLVILGTKDACVGAALLVATGSSA